jgi:hypothetical protein
MIRDGTSNPMMELARAVRKPQAPPVRVEKSSRAYDRRRKRRTIEEQTEELR